MDTSPRVCHEAKAIYIHTQMVQDIIVMSLLNTAYCKGFFRNSEGKCSPFEVGALCLTMALIPLGVVTIQNVLFHAFTYICELETSVPQVASQVATLLHTYTLHLSSSHYFSVHRLWRLNFLLFRHRQVATHVSSFHFITSFLWAPPVATQCSVLLKTLCVSVRVSGSLWASLGLSVRLCASLRLSGLLDQEKGLFVGHLHGEARLLSLSAQRSTSLVLSSNSDLTRQRRKMSMTN